MGCSSSSSRRSASGSSSSAASSACSPKVSGEPGAVEGEKVEVEGG